LSLRCASRVVSCRVEDVELARGLLEVFSSPGLDAGLGEQVSVLAKLYGVELCDGLLRAWGELADRTAWLVGAAELCRGLIATPQGKAVGAAFVGEQWRRWSAGPREGGELSDE